MVADDEGHPSPAVHQLAFYARVARFSRRCCVASLRMEVAPQPLARAVHRGQLALCEAAGPRPRDRVRARGRAAGHPPPAGHRNVLRRDYEGRGMRRRHRAIYEKGRLSHAEHARLVESNRPCAVRRRDIQLQGETIILDRDGGRCCALRPPTASQGDRGRTREDSWASDTGEEQVMTALFVYATPRRYKGTGMIPERPT